jgi:hypothetical protein
LREQRLVDRGRYCPLSTANYITAKPSLYVLKRAPALPFLPASFLTNIFVCFCWIFFRADSFSTAWHIIIRIFTWQNGIIQIYAWILVAIIMVCSAIAAAVIKAYLYKLESIDGFYPILSGVQIEDSLFCCFHTGYKAIK